MELKLAANKEDGYYFGPLPLRILGVLFARVHAGRVPPSLRELQRDTGLSLRGVQYHLERLKAEGLLVWEKGARTLRLLCRFIPAKEIP